MNQDKLQWNIVGFVDDQKAGQSVDGYPVLGTVEWLRGWKKQVYVTCAIGAGKTRKAIWDRVAGGDHIQPATIIDPTAIIGRGCEVGLGTIICAGTVLAIAVKTGFNCIINLNCTLGHDAVLESYCTVHPGSNLSGRVHIGTCTDIGTGSKVIQGITVSPNAILGAGTVVAQNIIVPGTYVGVPARKVK